MLAWSLISSTWNSGQYHRLAQQNIKRKENVELFREAAEVNTEFKILPRGFKANLWKRCKILGQHAIVTRIGKWSRLFAVILCCQSSDSFRNVWTSLLIFIVNFCFPWSFVFKMFRGLHMSVKNARRWSYFSFDSSAIGLFFFFKKLGNFLSQVILSTFPWAYARVVWDPCDCFLPLVTERWTDCS